MIEIYEYLYNKLKKCCPSVDYEDLKRNEEGIAIVDDVKVVYSLPDVLQDNMTKNRSNIPLQIDIWGRKEQIIEVEEVITKINRELRGKVYRSNNIPFFSIEKDVVWRNNIQDEDKKIRRTQLNYVIRIYEEV